MLVVCWNLPYILIKSLSRLFFRLLATIHNSAILYRELSIIPDSNAMHMPNRKWQDYVYIQCEYKSTKQKIKHLLREENKVKENKIS